MTWSKEMAEARRARRQAEREKSQHTAPRSIEHMTRDERVKRAAVALGLEHKALLKKIVALEDVINFRDESRDWRPPVVGKNSSRVKSGLREATPCFVLSDLHIGERVSLAESLGTNKYDLKIAGQRMSKCFDNMLWLRADMARTISADETVVFLNGDIISGDIHDELKETNDGGLRVQCKAARDMIAPGLLAMADATPGHMHVVCIDGNHGRVTPKRQIKTTVEHSAEHFGVYDPLAERIGTGPKGNIVWHVSDAPRFMIDVQGYRVSAQHGDMVRSMGGIGGTLVPLTRWAAKTHDADYYVVGHFHEADAYGPIIKNGALIGESAYTKWLGVESRPPEQVAFALDRVRGMRRFERVSVAA
jgi:hypothetical protein